MILGHEDNGSILDLSRMTSMEWRLELIRSASVSQQRVHSWTPIYWADLDPFWPKFTFLQQ